MIMCIMKVSLESCDKSITVITGCSCGGGVGRGHASEEAMLVVGDVEEKRLIFLSEVFVKVICLISIKLRSILCVLLSFCSTLHLTILVPLGLEDQCIHE